MDPFFGSTGLLDWWLGSSLMVDWPSEKFKCIDTGSMEPLVIRERAGKQLFLAYFLCNVQRFKFAFDLVLKIIPKLDAIREVGFKRFLSVEAHGSVLIHIWHFSVACHVQERCASTVIIGMRTIMIMMMIIIRIRSWAYGNGSEEGRALNRKLQFTRGRLSILEGIEFKLYTVLGDQIRLKLEKTLQQRGATTWYYQDTIVGCSDEHEY